MQKFRKIKYKKKIIKVYWKTLKDCWGLYEGSKLQLSIDPNQSKMNMAKTIYHELWHIICDLNEVSLIKKMVFIDYDNAFITLSCFN